MVAVGEFNSGLLSRDRSPEGMKYGYPVSRSALVARARALAVIAFRHAHRLIIDVTLGIGPPDQVDETWNCMISTYRTVTGATAALRS